MPAGRGTFKQIELIFERYRLDPHMAEVRKPGHFDKVCPTCVSIAASEGIGQEEIDHFNETSNEILEQARAAIVAAVDAVEPIRFGWVIANVEEPGIRIERVPLAPDLTETRIVVVAPKAWAREAVCAR